MPSRRFTRRARAAAGPVIAASVILTLSGCSSSNSVITNDGVVYELPSEVRDFTMAGETVSFEANGVQFSVVDRRVTMNAIPYGTVGPGDRVRISTDGRLFVNNEERRPFSLPDFDQRRR